MGLRSLSDSTWLAVTLLLAGATRADTPAPGYSIEVLPGGATYLTAPLSTGEFVGLSGDSVALFAEDGTFLQQLHSFGNLSLPHGIAIDPSESFAVVCRSSQYVNDTHKVDLATGATTFVSSASSRYPTFEPGGTVLLATSSGYGWFLERLDLETGQITLKGLGFAGISGSIDMDAEGNLYMAHGFSYSSPVIERFDAAVVAGPDLLVEGTGTVVADQFAGSPTALAVTPDGENYYVMDEELGLQRHLVQLGKGGRKLLATVDDWCTHVSLVPHRRPVVSTVGGPRLPGKVIYQNQPSGVWERKQLTVATGGPAPAEPTRSGPSSD